MTFTESIKVCLTQKYFTISGRASRSEYWWFQLFGYFLFIVCGLFAFIVEEAFRSMGGDPDAIEARVMLFLFFFIIFAVIAATVIPSFTCSIRRLHDASYSGWMLLLHLIPYVGGFVVFIFLLLKSDGDNKYGPRPAN